MSRSRRRVISFVTAILLVVMSLSSEAVLSIYRIDGPQMLALYVVYLAAASVLIGFAVWTLDRWCPALFTPAMSLGLAFLVFSLRLNFIDVVLELPFIWYLSAFLCVCLAIGLALWVGLTVERAPTSGFLVAAIAVLAAPAVVSTGMWMSHDSADKNAIPKALPTLPVGWETLRFAEKPNIYLLAFDSLIPKDVAASHMQIETPGYYRLTAELLRELPNSISFNVPSMNSLNAVMRFAQKRSILPEQNLFTGLSSSLLGEVARLNGYRVVTGWPGYVPSWRQGDGVDRVISPSFSGDPEDSFICEADMLPGRKIQIRGLFFCPVIMSLVGLVPAQRVVGKPFRETVLQAALEVPRAARPTLFFSYIYDPIGHTSIDFDFRSKNQTLSYRRQFLAQSVVAAEIIERSVVSIRSVDPTAVIMIFGDHGTYLSRGMDPSNDPRFVFSDRHRVFLAVANGGHRCGSPVQVHSGGRFNTPSRMLLDIMICLSGGVADLPVAFDEDPQLVRWVLR